MQLEGDGMSHPGLGYERTVDFILGILLLILKQASCSVVNFPVGRPTWQGIEGGLRPVVSKKLRLSVQQLTRNWSMQTTTWGCLEGDSSPVKLSDENITLIYGLTTTSWEVLCQNQTK